ncbi:MAG: 3-deoxy-D-manno-octulosonic acid transferase [Saprospiraceae bacterium]|nr:3-deoxy-D-manno-octulosonic acid transferase [Saprospiraceae bacterium]
MYAFVYDIFLRIIGFLVSILPLKGRKITAWKTGQKQVFGRLRQHQESLQGCIWFHVASLGEFEQAKPVIEAVRKNYPNERLLLTFFSPSGYEKMKDYNDVNLVTYLPLDTKANVQAFLQIVQPKLALFAKYEYWYNYLKALKKQNIPALLFSALFDENHLVFKWYGKPYQKAFLAFEDILVQDKRSFEIASKIFQQVNISGDTRVDRSLALPKEAPSYSSVEHFLQNKKCLIAGSTWPADIELLQPIPLNDWDIQLIIAPHEISTSTLESLKTIFPNSVRWSALHHDTHAQVLIIDEIGALKYLYQYASIAYIGGGFGKGIHNTLEPAAYEIPILFGPKHERFIEAVEMKKLGGAFSVNHPTELKEQVQTLLFDDEIYQKSAKATGDFLKQHANATKVVLTRIDKHLK